MNKYTKSISVSAATFARISAAAKQHGCMMADVVRAACAPILNAPQPDRPWLCNLPKPEPRP